MYLGFLPRFQELGEITKTCNQILHCAVFLGQDRVRARARGDACSGKGQPCDYLPRRLNAFIYDGQCQYYNIFFGRGMTRDLHDNYQRAKAQYGIITSLPFAAPEAEQSDAEQLKLYVRNEQNRERYWEEIVALRQKSHSLEMFYHQEMGKVDARAYSKRLRDIGLSGVWFAILEGITIASGTTRQEVDQAVQRIVPKNKLPFVYTFEVKESAQRRGARQSGTA